MSNLITVYSKPNCPQCDQTVKKLEQKGLKFEVLDVTENQEHHDKVQTMGYRQLPVVVVGEKHWSGFRPDHLGAL